MSKTVLYLQDVRKSYKVGNGQLDVLKGVDFTLEQGEWVCIYGASGSGKTTLLNIIGLLERPDSGKICFGDTDASKLSRSQAAKFSDADFGCKIFTEIPLDLLDIKRRQIFRMIRCRMIA